VGVKYMSKNLNLQQGKTKWRTIKCTLAKIGNWELDLATNKFPVGSDKKCMANLYGYGTELE
jgi:hypothetical protein